jgi:acetolactate synthase regulatory subunit
VNTLTLQLKLKQSEGALVRVLSVTRRRRFDLLSLKATPSSDAGFLDIQMSVQADRSSSFLIRQIEKLVDVSHLEILDSSDNGENSHEARAASSTA